MKSLVKPKTTYAMYDAVFSEMAHVHHHFGPQPPLRIENGPFVGEGDLAVTDFDDGHGVVARFATSMSINAASYPILDEEEILYLLIHETAHVIAGFYAGHGPEWWDTMEESAGMAMPYLSPRRRLEFLDYLPRWFNYEDRMLSTKTLDDWFAKPATKTCF